MQRRDSGRQKYSALDAIFYCIDLWDGHYVGVVGDPANGCYEYFDFREEEGSLVVSDCGYGMITIALRDALLRAEPLDPESARNGTTGPKSKDEICTRHGRRVAASL